MRIQKKAGHISSYSLIGLELDWLIVEWYECNKRVLRKKTLRGRDIALQFLNENPGLNEGDILYADEIYAVIVRINPCDAIVVRPRNLFETATVCYEIGNKHAALFCEYDDLLIPFERPLFSLFRAQGLLVKKEYRQLLTPLSASVSSHVQPGNNLFSKIMRLTNNSD